MQLTGSHIYNASPSLIWKLLMDADTLAKITPGISKLEKTGENSYKAIAQIKMGPVNGSFSGDVELLNKVEPESFTLRIAQNSKIGNVAADVHIAIASESDDQSVLSFKGKAKLSGLLARTGQRVLSGVSSTLSKQFFKALEAEVAAAK